MESDSVVFYYSVVNLLRIVIHYSKCRKAVQNVVIHCFFSSELLRIANSLQIVNSLRILFLVRQRPLGGLKGYLYFLRLFLAVLKIPLKKQVAE